MHNTLENFWEVFPKNSVTTKDALVELSFTAIQVVNSVRHLGVFEPATLLSLLNTCFQLSILSSLGQFKDAGFKHCRGFTC